MAGWATTGFTTAPSDSSACPISTSRRRRANRRRSGGRAISTTTTRSWRRDRRARSALGAVRFGSDTALAFRREILRPFLDQYLKDGAPKADLAPVTAFETGTNAWRRLQAWPSGCAPPGECAVKPAPLYLAAGL